MGATGNVLQDLQNAVIGYADALANDALNPQKSYSLDGQVVSWDEWRHGLLDRIKQLNQTINALNPYQIDTQICL
jgi:hypothetical protein